MHTPPGARAYIRDKNSEGNFRRSLQSVLGVVVQHVTTFFCPSIAISWTIRSVFYYPAYPKATRRGRARSPFLITD